MSVLAVLFAIAIEEWGWRTAWVVISVFVIVIVLPVAWFGFVNRPEDINQKVDGFSDSLANFSREDISVSHKEAIVSKSFAILAACTFLNSLLVTGMTFHQTNIL